MATRERAKPVTLDEEELLRKPRSPMGDAWRQLQKNKAAMISLAFIIVLIVMALTADLMHQAGWIDDYNTQHRGVGYAEPLTCANDDKDEDGVPDPVQFCFVFGADELGRDLLSRTIYGTRVSLAVGFIGSGVSLLIGTVYGVISGYYGGRIDNLMMRFVDFLYGIPFLPLIILMQVYFKSLSNAEVGGLAQVLVDIDNSMGGMFFLFVALGALSWIGMARLARGQVLSYKEKEFVEAARAVGAGDLRIIFIHLLPNVIGPLIVSETLAIPGYIFSEAFLSFIGLGVNPPTPSWGAMINAGREGIRSKPYLVLVPGTALALTTLAFNFLGDGLRDAFDPRLRGE